MATSVWAGTSPRASFGPSWSSSSPAGQTSQRGGSFRGRTWQMGACTWCWCTSAATGSTCAFSWASPPRVGVLQSLLPVHQKVSLHVIHMHHGTGLAEGMFDFVEIKTVKAVQVRPIDRESHWNCDGELLPENHISIRAHRGLVQVRHSHLFALCAAAYCLFAARVCFPRCVCTLMCCCVTGRPLTGLWVGPAVARG